MSDTDSPNVALARRYLRAIERGAQMDDPPAFFTDDFEFEEKPNTLVPAGARRDLAGMRAAAERGSKAVVSQRYDVRSAIAHGDHVALEVLWTGVLAVPLGSIPAGGEMRAHFAMFLDFRDGRIARQRNYDCFEPF
jgi:ketosteroid isomerase-like protein